MGVHAGALGRVLFAISLAVFGVQYLYFGKYVGGLPPVPPWAPGGAVGAYLVGVILLMAAIGLAANWNARLGALATGCLFLFCVLFLQLQHFSGVIHDGVDRTRAFEPFALAGALFVLAALLPANASPAPPKAASNHSLILLGRVIFAFSMVVFGWQHFLYAPFLATLVPAWLPLHLFWIYFTGVGMIVAALAIGLDKFGVPASLGLALMFGLWVLILHGPRVFNQPRTGDELSSLFVALAFCGASLIFAAALRPTAASPATVRAES
jgi:uncharacterized membrane protein